MNTVFQCLRSLSLFSFSLSHTFESTLCLHTSKHRKQRRCTTHNLKVHVCVSVCVCVCEPLTDCWTFPSKVHLNSHEASGSSWAFSDVCNYPVSRQCLVKDTEIHVLHRLRSIEEKAQRRAQCLSAGDVVVNEHFRARWGTQPTRPCMNKKKKTALFWNYSTEFQIKAVLVHFYYRKMDFLSMFYSLATLQ